jgi:hypothetical protein
VADSEGENPDFGELEPLGDLKPLDEGLEPLSEEAGESSLAEFDAEEFIPADFESLLTSATAEPDAEGLAAPQAAAPAVEVAAEDVASEDFVAEIDPPDEAEAAAAEKKAKPQSKLMANLDWAIAGGVAVILLVVGLVGLLNFSTAVYAISVGLVFLAFWRGRRTNDLYTVILGCALIAVLTAVYCLWQEVGRYRFDIKAREAKQHVSAPRLPETRFLA